MLGFYIPVVAMLSEAFFPSSFDTPMEEFVSAEYILSEIRAWIGIQRRVNDLDHVPSASSDVLQKGVSAED